MKKEKEGDRNDLFKKLKMSNDDNKLLDLHLDVIYNLIEKLCHELNLVINLKIPYAKDKESSKKVHNDTYTRIIAHTLPCIIIDVMSKTEQYFDCSTMFFSIPAIYNEFRNNMKEFGKLTHDSLMQLDCVMADIIKNLDEYIDNTEQFLQKDIDEVKDKVKK